MTNHRLLNAEKQEDGDYILTVEHIPSLVGKLLGAEPKEAKYHGNCTVWHEMPSFRRCSTRMESLLAGYWERTRYEEKQKRE